MIPVQVPSPNPPPMPPTPPGIGPPPPLPGAAPPAQAAGPGQPPQGAQPPPNAGPPPDVSADQPAAGDVRPRLIPGTDATSGDIPATPAEQKDLEQTLIKAGNMIHSRASRDQVLASLHDPSGTVSQAVGRTAAHILMTIDGQRQATGAGPLDHDVLKEAAAHVIPELMDVGISAGLFPIKPWEGKGDGGTVGVGADPYNREIRMAMLEATKIYGEAQLRRPDAAQLTEQAGNDWADNVRKEVSDGSASPAYMAKVRPQNAEGAPALIDQSQQGGAPSGP